MTAPYYSHGGITLYHARWEDVLPTLADNSVDLVVMSPPYNKRGFEGHARTTHAGDRWQRGRNLRYDDYDDDMPEPEYQTWQAAMLTECYRLLKPGGACCYNHKHRVKDFTVSLPTDWIARTPFRLRQEIVWQRGNSPNIDPIRFLSTTERIYWLFKGDKPAYFDPTCLRWGEVWEIFPTQTDQHPVPFPEALVGRCIQALSRPGELVLDPFAGWGTTLRVAKDLGRRALGTERLELYCQRAATRMQQTVMFEEVSA